MPIKPISIQQAPPAAKQKTLTEAVATWQTTSLPEYGKDVAFDRYPKSSIKDLVTAATGLDFEDQDQFEENFAVMHGPQAAKTLAASLREIGKQLSFDGDTEEAGARTERSYSDVADAVIETFSTGFKEITLIEHMIREDGDIEIRMIAGKKSDGTWTALTYSDNPF